MAATTEIGGLVVRVPTAGAAERSGLASSRSLGQPIPLSRRRFRSLACRRRAVAVRSARTSERIEALDLESKTNGSVNIVSCFIFFLKNSDDC